MRINTDALEYNAKKISKLCHENGIRVVAVTKVTCGDPKIAKIYLRSGADMIGDSRLQNIIKMRNAGVKGPFMLIRIPMLSEIPLAVKNADVILVSELETLKQIAEEAAKMKKIQEIMYMVDVGDLREGVWYADALDEIIEASKIPHIHLYGIGTNLGCYGGVIPDEERMQLLVNVAKKAKQRRLNLNVLSGGNTAAIHLIEKGTLPSSINEYRIGEAIALGTDVTNGRIFKFLRQDTFTLLAEVIEVKIKPSVPEGKIGRDSMGRVPFFEDKGKRVKAIVAVGEQDISFDGLIPLSQKIKVLHASSDHTVLDVTDSPLNVGDKVRFRLSYAALLRAMTSPYVVKIYEGDS